MPYLDDIKFKDLGLLVIDEEERRFRTKSKIRGKHDYGCTDNQINPSYAADVKRAFNGNPYHENFKKDGMKTQRNTWISKETNHGINNYFPTGNILHMDMSYSSIFNTRN